MTTQPPPPVAAAIEAANMGDTDGFLRTFDPRGFVDDWGRVFSGHEAIRAWSDAEFIGVRVSLAVTSSETVGDVTTVAAQVGGNGFNGPSRFTFVVAGDAVASMTITE